MLEKTLDKIYVCRQCRAGFLFKADTADHERLWGHDQFATIALEIVVPMFKGNSMSIACSDCGCEPEECKASISPRECPNCKLDQCCCWAAINTR